MRWGTFEHNMEIYVCCVYCVCVCVECTVQCDDKKIHINRGSLFLSYCHDYEIYVLVVFIHFLFHKLKMNDRTLETFIFFFIFSGGCLSLDLVISQKSCALHIHFALTFCRLGY